MKELIEFRISVSSSPYDQEIGSILEKIQEYRNIKRKKINKMEVIMSLKDALIEQNFPPQMISSKILNLLKNYDISERYILMVLDSRFKSPGKTIKSYLQ